MNPWFRLGSFIGLHFASASPLCFLPWPPTNLLTPTVSYFTPHPCLAQPFQPWSLPSGYTVNHVFVLELFLLLPQWAAKVVNLSCSLLPLLVKKQTNKKQPKPQLPWDSTANPWELALIFKFTEGTKLTVWLIQRWISITMIFTGWSVASLKRCFQAGFHNLRGNYWKCRCPEESGKFVNYWNKNGAKYTDSGARHSLNPGSSTYYVIVGNLDNLVPWSPQLWSGANSSAHLTELWGLNALIHAKYLK